MPGELTAIKPVIENSAPLSGPPGRSSAVWQKRDWLYLAGVILLASAMFIPALGLTPLIDSSEGYYAEGAREMFESGNYITPQLNYQAWFEKPVLIYWLTAASYRLLGVTELAARMPSALSGILLCSFLYVFARRFLRRRAALFSTLAMLSCPLTAIIGRLSLTDMPLALTTTLGTAGLFAGLTTGSVAYLVLAYLAMGLGLLLKGPIGLGFPAVVIAGYVLLTARSLGDIACALKKLWIVPGLLITALVAVPWYFAVTLVTHGQFFTDFFIGQNLGRMAGQTVHRNPIWYYIPFLAGGFMPWCLTIVSLPQVAYRAWEHRKEFLTARQRLVFFSFVWSAVLFVALSLIPTKLATYILPLFPGLALLSGISLDTIIKLNKRSKLMWTGILLPLAAAIGLFCLRLFAGSESTFFFVMLGYGMFIAAGFALFGYLVWRRDLRPAVYVLAAAAYLGCATLVPTGILSYYESRRADFHKIVISLKDRPGTIAVLGPSRHSAEFYLKQRIAMAHSPADLKVLLGRPVPPGASDLLPSDKADWLIVKDMDLPVLKRNANHARKIACRGRWYLFSLTGR